MGKHLIACLTASIDQELSIIGTPLTAGSQAPKKIRKLVQESGIPPSLRGKVWGWFMASNMPERRPGLFEQLARQHCPADGMIDRDVTTSVLRLSNPH